MRVAYLDCFSGISGDMLLGALVDAGLSPDDLRSDLAKLPVGGYRIEVAKTQRAGLAATKATVVLEEVAQPHRRLPDIVALIERSTLQQDDTERSAAVFLRLGLGQAPEYGRATLLVCRRQRATFDQPEDIGQAAVRRLD